MQELIQFIRLINAWCIRHFVRQQEYTEKKELPHTYRRETDKLMDINNTGVRVQLEKVMATHSSILARRIIQTLEPIWLQSMGSQRVRHDWATNTHTHTHTHTHTGSNRKKWEPRKWENLSNWKEVRDFWWQSQPARWRGVLPDSRKSMNKDIDILKECKRLSVDRDTGRKGPVQARSAEAGGWRMVDHGRPHWPLPSRCWESLSILSRAWWSNLTDTECALTHSLTQFCLRGYSVPESDSDSGGTKGDIQSTAPAQSVEWMRLRPCARWWSVQLALPVSTHSSHLLPGLPGSSLEEG